MDSCVHSHTQVVACIRTDLNLLLTSSKGGTDVQLSKSTIEPLIYNLYEPSTMVNAPQHHYLTQTPSLTLCAGAAVVANSPCFEHLCTHRSEYEEEGPRVAFRKFLY